MVEQVKIFNCGTYHPYRYRGEKNPRAGDRLSRSMMDLKDEDNQNHQSAIKSFSALIIKELDRFFIAPNTPNRRKFISVPFEITVVPSHVEGKISAALETIGKDICKSYKNGNFVQSLKRTETVASAHKDGGDRSVDNHMTTIKVTSDVKSKVILLIDDVTTSGGSMTACANLLKSKGARIVLPLALLVTANYEE